jgi:ribosomal protein S18 acetylase RimI-like enzyme
MPEIRKLTPARWRDYRALRLEALKGEPEAFGSSYEEEIKLAYKDWRNRLRNVMFAFYEDKPVGMIAVVFNKRYKTKHIANIYSFYVSKGYRGNGLGGLLMGRALSTVKKHGGIAKVTLSVNTKQTPAINLYKKNGFVISGKLRKELKIKSRFYDEFIMEKLL